MDVLASYKRNLTRIRRFFFRKAERGYLFAVADDHRLRKRINEILLEEAAQKGLRIALLFPEKDVSLIHQMQERAAQSDGFIVNGLSPYFDKDARKKNMDFIVALNFSREQLYALNKPVLFWISTEEEQLILHYAYDLYSQRVATSLRFEEQFQPEEHVSDEFLSLPTSEAAEPVEKIELDIKLKEEQLKEAVQLKLPPNKLLSDYVLPLAQKYAEAGEKEKAIRLIGKYRDALARSPLEVKQALGQFWLKLHNKEELDKLLKDALPKLKELPLPQQAKWYELAANHYENLHHDHEHTLYFLDKLLQVQRKTGDKKGEGRTLNNISQIYAARGDYETALKYLEESLKISREIGDKSGEGETLNNIGLIYNAYGDYATALKYLEESLEMSREMGDKKGEGETLNNIGLIYNARGDYETALKYLEESLEISREIGDKSVEGATLNNIAEIYVALGDYEVALKYLEESLKIRREIGDKSGEGTTLNNIAEIYATLGDYEMALQYWEESLEISREIGDKRVEGRVLNNIATIAYVLGDDEAALKYLEESLEISREMGDKSGEGTMLNNIAEIYAARDDYDTALQYWEESLEINREIGDKSGEGAMLNNISQIYAARGDYETALKLLEQSLEISREIGDKKVEGMSLFNIGMVYALGLNKVEEGLPYLAKAYAINQEMGDAQLQEALEHAFEQFGISEEQWRSMLGRF